MDNIVLIGLLVVFLVFLVIVVVLSKRGQQHTGDTVWDNSDSNHHTGSTFLDITSDRQDNDASGNSSFDDGGASGDWSSDDSADSSSDNSSSDSSSDSSSSDSSSSSSSG